MELLVVRVSLASVAVGKTLTCDESNAVYSIKPMSVQADAQEALGQLDVDQQANSIFKKPTSGDLCDWEADVQAELF